MFEVDKLRTEKRSLESKHAEAAAAAARAGGEAEGLLRQGEEVRNKNSCFVRYVPACNIHFFFIFASSLDNFSFKLRIYISSFPSLSIVVAVCPSVLFFISRASGGTLARGAESRASGTSARAANHAQKAGLVLGKPGRVPVFTYSLTPRPPRVKKARYFHDNAFESRTP